MAREASAWQDASRVNAIRAAGLTILREIEGRPTRVIVDLETLLAEADGIARGLRSGFIDEKARSAASDRPLSAEEAEKLRAEINEFKRDLQAAQERLAAEDAEDDA